MREETLEMQRYFKLSETQAVSLDKEVDKVYAHIDRLRESKQLQNVYNLSWDLNIPGFKIRGVWITQPEPNIEFANYHAVKA